MNEDQRTHIFDNGLVLLTEHIPESEADSYVFRVPFGTVDDPDDRQGLAGIIAEMIVRGAGRYDNRELVYAFENLGVDSSESVYTTITSFSGSLVADKLVDALELTADILRRPWFPEEELESARQVLAQELAGLEDEPSRLLLYRLGEIFFPAPWGRPSFGTAEGLAAITLGDIVETYKAWYSPNGAILSIAGKIDHDAVTKTVERLFGDWKGQRRIIPDGEKPTLLKRHIPFDSAQTHIGLIWPALRVDHEDYLPLRCAVGVLGSGMSCRLFDAVREKRGLCYTVGASYNSQERNSNVLCYCGSGLETAQEALDVILAELRRLTRHGITQTELDRCKIRLKSSLVMAQESTGVHAGRMAADYNIFGRVRSLQEILDRFDSLSLDEVNEKIAEYPIGPLRMVTLGPSELDIDSDLLG
jgi:predicted Zn-dependent peptidase